MADVSIKATGRLPLLSALAWCATVCALGAVAVAAVWNDHLGAASPAMLFAQYLAFMCQVFAYHAGIAMVPVILLAACLRRWRLLALAVITFAIGAGPDLLTARPRARFSYSGAGIKLMSVNLMYGQGDAAALLAQISREAPDVLVFQEWTPSGAAQLRDRLAAAYPHSFERAQDDAFGQAVFARRPFVGEPRAYPPMNGWNEPQITFAVDVAGRPMRLTDVHLLPPVNLQYFAEQRAMAGRYAAWLSDGARDDRPDVIVGDINATSRTSMLAALYGAGLQDAQSLAGWWRGSTWPRDGWLAWAPGIQLDHVLVTNRVVCLKACVGEDFGSDHRPVIVQLAWPASGVR